MIKLGNYFLRREKNRFNIKNYIKEYSDVDDSLLKNNRPVHCNLGDILIFDRKTLHAATHPIKHTRLSLNFQITFENKNNVLKQKILFYK